VVDDVFVDAVIIATPVSSHYLIARKCLLKGKHVLCEKVLSTNLQEIKELKSISETNKIVLEIGFTFLYNSIVERIKKEISKNKLGNIIYLTFKRTGFGPIREDVNAYTDLMSHDLSMCLYWIGIPDWVQAVGINVIQNSVSDVSFVQLGYKNGVIVQMFCSWITPLKQRIVEIVGSNGMIIFDDVNNSEKLKMITPSSSYYKQAMDFGSFQLSLKSGDIVVPNIEYPEPLMTEVQGFINKVKSLRKQKEEFDTVEISENVAHILNMIEKSIINNSSKIYFDA
jgi:predicted dehydrogenase